MHRAFVVVALSGIVLLFVTGGMKHAMPEAGAVATQTTSSTSEAAPDLELPPIAGAVRFAVIGDAGTGKKEQYEVAAEMAKFHQVFPFEFVIMLGDNLYGGSSPQDYERKFARPYEALLSQNVKFYAALGNHDNPNERFYKPFNMSGERYYSFKKGKVEFFALDSTYMDATQLEWLEQRLHASDAQWKICFFHHPLYSDGKYHGPDTDLRARLEPLLKKYGVDVVFSGHEHFYERIAPQDDIYYFILGNSGELRYRNTRPSKMMVKGFDTDRGFMLAEIAGDQFYFQTISRTGETVDMARLMKNGAKSGTAPKSLINNAGNDPGRVRGETEFPYLKCCGERALP